jgi:hypothetical protein
MRRSRRRKCKNCQELFIPDHRNRKKQEYCSKPECRKASKSASQRKWHLKEENRSYFCGPVNVRRVQEWRKNNPGYWKKRPRKQKPLQDHSIANHEGKQEDKENLTNRPLQDLLLGYPAVIVGLLAHLSGSVLQDDIVQTGLRMQQLGQDILTNPLINGGGLHDSKQTPHTLPPDPPGP